MTSIAIRVNENPPLEVPAENLFQSPGSGLTARIRILVPYGEDPMTVLTKSRIFAIVKFSRLLSALWSTKLTNKISVDNVFLLKESDSCDVQANQLFCPLRISQVCMLAITQGKGQLALDLFIYLRLIRCSHSDFNYLSLPLQIIQTIYLSLRTPYSKFRTNSSALVSHNRWVIVTPRFISLILAQVSVCLFSFRSILPN